jgi:hypothetical protein
MNGSQSRWIVMGALLALLPAGTTARAQGGQQPVPVSVENAVKVESILSPVGIVAPMFAPADLVSTQGLVEAGARHDLSFPNPAVVLRDVSVAPLGAPTSGCLLRAYVNDILVKVGIIIPPWDSVARPRPGPLPRGAVAGLGDWNLPAVDLGPNDRVGFELTPLVSGPGKCRAVVVAVATLPAVQ